MFLSATPKEISRTTTTFLLFFTALTIAISAPAGTPEKLGWEDLLSPEYTRLQKSSRKLRDRFAEFDREARKVYRQVAHELRVLKSQAAGEITEAELTERDLAVLEENPSSKHPDATALWRDVDALRTKMDAASEAVDPGIDGRTVRMPGYVLPLEFDGEKVTEFLLVPYVGACIHTPPPPPNQMVHVKPAEAFISEGMYTPVWVEGRMSTEAGTYNLSLVDGARPVDIGYSMQASSVEIYK